MKSNFEEKFNINDKIKYKNSSNEWVKILSFEGESEEYFTGINDDGEVCGDFTKRDEFLNNWSLYKEPIKKDLEVFKTYYVHSSFNGVEIITVNMFKSITDLHSHYGSLFNEIIAVYSKEQAIERGLKID